MMKYEFRICIQGIRLRLSTNSLSYVEYLESYFGPFVEFDKSNYDIEVELELVEEWNKKHKIEKWGERGGYQTFGRRICIKDYAIICDGFGQLSDLKLKCVYGKKTQVFGFLNLHRSKYIIKRYYQQVIRKDTYECYKVDNYAALTYYMIYYPILYSLEQKNLHPLHASGVVFDGHGILLPGLPGVGKSTLCMAFMSMGRDSAFLSDNIVLHDKDKIYSFFEPLKLDQNALGLISDKEGIQKKTGTDSYYDRDLFRIDKSNMVSSVKPDTVLIPARGNENSIKPISAQKALQMSLDFNNNAGELNSYFSYSSAQNLCVQNENITNYRINHLKELYEKTNCYMLSIGSGKKLDSILYLIKKTI